MLMTGSLALVTDNNLEATAHNEIGPQMLVAFLARWMVLGEYAQGWWLILVKCDAENLIVVD